MHISFRKNPSRILIICALCVVFLIGTILGHLNTDGSSEDRSFQTYTDRLFREEVSGNMLNLHYSIAYPENSRSRGPPQRLARFPLRMTTVLPDMRKLLKNSRRLIRQDFLSQIRSLSICSFCIIKPNSVPPTFIFWKNT